MPDTRAALTDLIADALADSFDMDWNARIGAAAVVETLEQDTMAGAPILRFADAEQIGVDLHDRWEKMTGQAPLARDDMGWADVVQFVVRRAREIVTERETSNG